MFFFRRALQEALLYTPAAARPPLTVHQMVRQRLHRPLLAEQLQVRARRVRDESPATTGILQVPKHELADAP